MRFHERRQSVIAGRRPSAGALLFSARVVTTAIPGIASAQRQAVAPAALVFDRVTVVDVERGTLVPDQRVVVVGNRIHAMGPARVTARPKGAWIVNARGKYLIPGLWDFHIHPSRSAHLFYPLLLANGVTGIRDAWSTLPLDTLVRWRRAILAGTRVGPPRQILSGDALDEQEPCTRRAGTGHICVARGDTADARHVVDSLKASGADIIKTYDLSKATYFAVAAAARRAGMPFGGHLGAKDLSPLEASDSGAGILDHDNASGLHEICWAGRSDAGMCRVAAERLRRNGTWHVPTLTWNFIVGSAPNDLSRAPAVPRIITRVRQYSRDYWAGTARMGNWLSDSADAATIRGGSDSNSLLGVVQQAGLPLIAGTDAIDHLSYVLLWTVAPGFTLHGELAMYAAEGLAPLEALRSATLNPAKMLHATDSLGTVAPGKLADLVLLDANPLDDITNTTTIRAVVANGRYFDRAALDRMLADVRDSARQALRLPLATLAGRTVVILPPGEVIPRFARRSPIVVHHPASFENADRLRADVDSAITSAVMDRAARVTWIPSAAVRAAARRLALDTMPLERYAWEYGWGGVAPDWYPRGLSKSFRRDMLPTLRRLAEDAGGSVVLMPKVVSFDYEADGMSSAFLDLVLLDTTTGTVLWENHVRGDGDTPGAALAAALAIVVPER